MFLFNSKKRIIWEIFLVVCIVGFYHRNFGIHRSKRWFQSKQVFGELLLFLRIFFYYFLILSIHTSLFYESNSIIGLLSQNNNNSNNINVPGLIFIRKWWFRCSTVLFKLKCWMKLLIHNCSLFFYHFNYNSSTYNKLKL